MRRSTTLGGQGSFGLEQLESRTVLSATPINLDLNPFGPSYPTDFVEVGDVTYFVANDGVNGRELWKTDGAIEGTQLVADIRPGAGSSYPSSLVNIDGTLFFAADDGASGLELWKSDGTAEGTVLVRDLRLGSSTDDDEVTTPNSSSPLNLTNVNGALYFTADDGVSGRELWKSDGTSAGTRLVRDIFTGNIPSTSTPQNADPTDLTTVNGVLFFTATNLESGRELWKTDGTAVGTVLVKDLYTGTYPYYQYGYTGYSEYYLGQYPNNSNPGLLTAFNGELYFVAANEETGAELWKSDGTEAGTVVVKDIWEGEQGAFSNLDSMVATDDSLFFTANDGEHGAELWKSDGTEAGTVMVKDIWEGEQGILNYYTNLTAVDGVVFFAGNDGEHGRELWKSDGTEAGTVMVKDIAPGRDTNNNLQHSYPAYLKSVDGVLFFSAFTPENGRELWMSDGTEAGTVLVEDRIEGVLGTSPNNLADINGVLFFSSEEDNARELWTLAEGDDFSLTIVVDGEFIDIPAMLGVAEDGTRSSFFTWDDSGQVIVAADSGATLGDFFDVWRTNAGQVGDNPDATLSANELLGHTADYEHTLQMFVNGQLTTEFDEYVVQDDDEIVLAYGTNPVISLNTNFGPIIIELFEGDTPGTVENFLNYVNDGDYLNSFFHRSVNPTVGQSITIVQGGGFTTDSATFTDTSQFTAIPTDDPIENEPGISNTRGTISMAKLSGNPDSATSSFFFNLTDDSTVLDSEANGAFTVFGQVLGMTTVDEIGSHTIDTTNASPYATLPLGSNDTLTVVESIEGYGDLTGVAYADADLDGVRDNGEDGIQGVVIYADANNNSVLDDGEASATTDAQGRYRLQAEPGDYTLRAVFTSGGFFTTGSLAATTEIGGEVTGLDFGGQSLTTPVTLDLLAATDTGTADDDNATSRNNGASTSTLQFQVTGVVSGAEVRIYAGDTLIGVATASGDEVVVTTDGAQLLADGMHQFTATQFLSGLESDPTESLSVTIDATPPAGFTTDAPEYATTGELFDFDVESGDEGAEGVVYSLVGAPDGMTIDPTTGVFSWTPEAAQGDPLEFAIVLGDAAGNSVSQEVSLTVLSPAPAFPDRYETDEETPLVVNAGEGVLANDGDADSNVTTATVITGPAHGQLEFNSDGSFTYTPDADFFGTDSFSYKGSAEDEETNVAKVTIDVHGLPDPPAPSEDEYQLNEDEPLSVSAENGVLANDQDVDGDSLTAELANGPANGTIDFMEDGSFVYTPNENYFGEDSFTYQVSDGDTTSDPVVVTLTVNAVNDPPVAVDESHSVDEEGSLSVDASEGVLVNDSDIESSITAVLVTTTSHGELSLAEDGSFTYTPDADFFGSDSFTYVASDGDAQSAEVTVEITVNPQPDDPTAEDDAFTAPNDGSQQSFDVLANDTSEPDGDQPLTLVSVTQGSEGGTVAISGSSIVYSAPVGFLGTETFTYTIEDSDGLTSTATVTVSVVEAADNVLSGYVYVDTNGNGQRNDGEAGVPGVLITLAGESNTGDDIEQTVLTGDDGSYAFIDLPAGDYQLTESQPAALDDGTASTTVPSAVVGDDAISNIVLSGGVTYEENNFGKSSLLPQYSSIVWFFASSSDHQTVFRKVVASAEEEAGNTELAGEIAGESAVSAAATADAYTGNEDTELIVASTEGVLQNDGDNGSDGLAAVLTSHPTNGELSFADDGSFTYTPDNNFAGEDTFAYVATDGVDVSPVATVTVTVESVNDPPIAQAESYDATVDAELTVSAEDGLLANAEDIDSSLLSAALAQSPTNGSVTVNSDGSFVYTPDAGFSGQDSFTYRVSDGLAVSEQATVSISVVTAQSLAVESFDDNNSDDTLLDEETETEDEQVVDAAMETFETV